MIPNFRDDSQNVDYKSKEKLFCWFCRATTGTAATGTMLRVSLMTAATTGTAATGIMLCVAH